MKQVFLLTVVTTLFATSAQAVEFNKDAMKAMQEEGLKMVEESQGARAYKAANNFCLDMAGNGLVVRKCNANSKTQKWILDSQNRLVAHDGRCVAGPQLGKCGTSKAQKWRYDGKHRLTNENNMCLQVQASPPQAGTKVGVAGCRDNVAAQVWK
jgi:hypothetical protein